ncbi:MAG: isoaspartyl peptidase/L-asparaginase family protein, partial [Chloroflexota bacterium]|nr:isoaspartyl peptidase/L-asparaginase family protein [Chloroflexota bacterium]
MRPKIVVHGGAGEIVDEHLNAHLSGCKEAIEIGWAILDQGGTSLTAVEHSIRLLEDNPVFDAGRGSYLNQDGFVEMDAMVMKGDGLNIGAVAGVSQIRNPISLAIQILHNSKHNMLGGQGALKFAQSLDLEECEANWFITESTRNIWKKEINNSEKFGTVGCVALDAYGNITAGTSTGGTKHTETGRIGDTPLVGCGTYADNTTAGVSATGDGEAIMKVVLSKLACDLTLTETSVEHATNKSIQILNSRTRSQAGLIMIDNKGNLGCAFNTPRMSRAWIDNQGKIK